MQGREKAGGGAAWWPGGARSPYLPTASNGGTARERVESAARERVRVRVGAVGAIMVTPRLLCLLGAILAGSSKAQEQELPREAKQLSSQPEQKYDLELSFPVDSVLATNVNDDRRARIDNLIQEILLATQVKCSTDHLFTFSHKILSRFLEIFLPKERLKGGEVSSGTSQWCLCRLPGVAKGHGASASSSGGQGVTMATC